VRIYKPAKSAMQSGRSRTRQWVVEFESEGTRTIDPLMGWVSSSDTQTQVRLEFDSREEAIAYAEKKGLTYSVQEPEVRHFQPKNYAEKFGFRRAE
jgi:hypothetical protein